MSVKWGVYMLLPILKRGYAKPFLNVDFNRNVSYGILFFSF